jgi:hypothetical protein
LWGYTIERRLPESTVTAQATVIDKELWAVYPVYYEVTYSFNARSPEDEELREYTQTAEVSRNFYNLLYLGDQIVITYPTRDPDRSVLGPEFRTPLPWVIPLLGLSLSVVLFILGRRQLRLYHRRQELARRHSREE